MKKSLKRTMSALLVLVMLICSAPVYEFANFEFLEAFQLESKAASNILINGVDIGYASGDYFTKNGKSCANSYWASGRCHKNGVCDNATHEQCNCMRYWPTGNPSTCEVDLLSSQCFAFARYCQYAFFGYFDGNKKSYFTDITGTISSGNCTASKLKSELLNCAPATHVRMYTHSISILSTSDYGVDIAECNYDGYCKIRAKTYSWSEFSSYVKEYGGIEYANACNQSVYVPTFTIKYNANGGSGSMASKTIKLNDTVTLATNTFTKTGYTFNGWHAKRSSDNKWYCIDTWSWLSESEINSNGYSKVTYPNFKTMTFESSWTHNTTKDDTFTFYAQWVPNTLTVNYNANGGAISSDKSGTYKLSSNLVYNVSDGSKYAHKWTYNNAKEKGLTNGVSSFGLYKTGYTFAGWGTKTSGGTVFDDNDTTVKPTDITSDIKNGSCSVTLYAQWTVNKYTVTFNANGGSVSEASRKVNYGSTVGTLPNASRSGYSFKGWYTSASGGTKISASQVIKSNVTYYAQWACLHSKYNSSVTTAPTCTSTGVKTYTCATCGHKYTETIAKTAHTTVTDKAVSATCTTAGKTEGSHCSKCNAVIKAQTTIPATGHKDGEWKVTTQPTYTSTGVKTLYCAVCGKAIRTESIPKLVASKPEVKSVDLDADNIEINYHNGYKFNPNVTVEGDIIYKVEYSSSNSNCVSVDENGNIYGNKKGNAVITCTVTDAIGNVVTDTCTVNVTFTFGQWLLYIICFGWIWM